MSGVELKERLAAILAADVAGYSRLMAADERATVAALDAARTVFRTQIEGNRGRVIDMAGDSVLAVFETATGAASAAIAIQQELNASTGTLPEDRRMRFRIGIHMGDVIEKADGTVYGDGVNIAARLEGLAEPGGISISDAVRGTVKGKVNAAFEDQGEQQVKNIAEPVRAFSVKVDDGAAEAEPSRGFSPTRTQWRRSKAKSLIGAITGIAKGAFVAAGIGRYRHSSRGDRGPSSAATNGVPLAQGSALSIMVLPFANQTGDEQKGYIADALTSSITSDLSRIRDAFVISTATAFAYKDKPTTLHQIGRDLRVHFVLQGSVFASGEKVRFSAQLADTLSGAQLWTETFDGELTDLFALQDRVTTRIGNTIGREMVIVAARASEKRKSSPTAADLLLRAEALRLMPGSLKNYQQTEDLLRRVLAQEPNNIGAKLRLARVLVVQPFNFSSKLEEDVKEQKYIEARDLAVEVRELAPDEPGAYGVLGMYALSHDDYNGYRRACETVIALQPKDRSAHNDLAASLILGGEPENAIEVLNRAIKLDPAAVDDSIRQNMGEAYFMAGDDDATIEWFLKTLDSNPAMTVS